MLTTDRARTYSRRVVSRAVKAAADHRVQADNLRGTNRSPGAIREAMLAHRRIWVVGTKNLRAKENDRVGLAETEVLRDHFAKQRVFPAPGAPMRSLEVDLFVRSDS